MTDQADPTQEVLRVWEGVAPGWERYRDRLFESLRPVSDWLVDAIAPSAGEAVLELAAGPGETGFVVAERVGPSGQVLSTDLAPGMVGAARRGAEARGLANVECRVMDAQRMDPPDASFDAVLSRFGFMLMPEPARAMAEAHRVLKPGGRFAFAVWGPPERNPWIGVIGMTLTQLGLAPSGDPFAPGGIFSLSPPDATRTLTASAGFTGIRVEEIAVVQRFQTFAEYWDFQTEIAGPRISLRLCPRRKK